MRYIISLRVDGNNIILCSSVFFHRAEYLIPVSVIFRNNQVVAKCSSPAILHKVAARMYDIHHVIRDIKVFRKLLGDYVLTYSLWSVICEIHNRQFVIIEHIKRRKISCPVRIIPIYIHIQKCNIFHVYTSLDKDLLCFIYTRNQIVIFI